MKLIVSIDTNEQGDIGVFMRAIGSPANKTEALYAEGIEKICKRLFAELALRLAEKGAGDVANANDALSTTLLHAHWRKGQIPPAAPEKN